MTAPGCGDALTRLESELFSVEAVAECLMLVAHSTMLEDFGGTTALNYLGRQLNLHHREARAAFDEIHAAMVTRRVAPG
jgi:hypothetical protein